MATAHAINAKMMEDSRLMQQHDRACEHGEIVQAAKTAANHQHELGHKNLPCRGSR
jgi:hypothetical protein